MKRKLPSKEDLYNLYINKKMSARQIGLLFNLGKTTILELMKKYDIKTRSKSETSKMIIHPIKYNIPKKDIERLYHKEKLSMGQIAEKYGVHSSLIFNKMKKYNIPTRTFEEGNRLSIPRRSMNIAKAVIKYPKKQFSNNLMEKAYLLGFTSGDLHVSKNKYGQTIKVDTSTTKEVQIELVKSLFEPYTKVGAGRNKYGNTMLYCNLDLSFSFLLDYKNDKIPKWILNEDKYFILYLAGYIDAEGHFGVYNGIGAFSLGSYDKGILFGVANQLEKFNILTEGPKLECKKGYIDKRGIKWNGDLWKFRIRRMRELYKFINIIKPYIKHKKRYNDMISVEKNLLSRTGRINLNEEILHNNPDLLCK